MCAATWKPGKHSAKWLRKSMWSAPVQTGLALLAETRQSGQNLKQIALPAVKHHGTVLKFLRGHPCSPCLERLGHFYLIHSLQCHSARVRRHLLAVKRCRMKSRRFTSL